MSYHIVEWYTLFSRAADITWLTVMIIKHVEEITAVVCHACAAEAAKAQRKIIRFEAIALNNGNKEYFINSVLWPTRDW